jgi:hypothetical protein
MYWSALYNMTCVVLFFHYTCLGLHQ